MTEIDAAAARALDAQREVLRASGGECVRLVDGHGVEIAAVGWRPLSRPRAIIQIVHGVGEHAGRYASLASTLAGEGFAVVADDHRGHGRTGVLQHGRLDRLGELGPGGTRATVEAIRLVGETATSWHPGIPLVLLGHSWGSFLAQKLVNRSRGGGYAAVILTGTALAVPGSVHSGDFNRRFRGEGATGFEWLSRDAQVQRGALADPLMFGGTALQLFGVRGAIALLTAPVGGLRADLPVLIAIGSDDPVGGPRSVRRLAQRYRSRGLGDVTVRIYEGARHEVFNEINRDEVIGDVLGWLDARLPGR